MKKKLNCFFLEAGINHFGKLDQANKILRYFLNSSFKNITYMIQSEKFYKKYKKRGLNFKLSYNFYLNAIKECKKKKKKFGLAVCDAVSFKGKRDLNVDFGELTPTLKIRRIQIRENWASEIESMYEGA